MFVAPEIEVIKFEQVDVIATSTQSGGSGPIVLPEDEA